MKIIFSEDGQLIALLALFAGLNLPLNSLLLHWLLLMPRFICHISILYKHLAKLSTWQNQNITLMIVRQCICCGCSTWSYVTIHTPLFQNCFSLINITIDAPLFTAVLRTVSA